jgi:hypothetical protein
VSFDPKAPVSPSPVTISSGDSFYTLACPSSSQCTAVTGSGKEVTFDPAAPAGRTSATVDSSTVYGLACPTVTQCTAVDFSGQEVTFNPKSPGSPTPKTVDGTAGLNAVACPSTSLCVAVDNNGEELAFNPAAPGTPALHTIAPGTYLAAVACPSTTQCSAVDGLGRVVTFNPGSPAGASLADVDGGRYLVSISCPSTSFCVAVDGLGYAVEGNPAIASSWKSHRIAGATYIAAVSCTSTALCVASDHSGHALIGIVPAPSSSAPPKITGTLVQGQKLTEAHGTWANGPTSYAYRWEDCDASGGSCSAIAGATAQTHVLTAADVGHTIRVQESATNAGGTGGPVSSAQTAVVKAAPKPACVVPKVRGKTLARAKAAIKSHHCHVGKIRRAFSKHVRKGRVISQKPKPHRVLRNGARVNLVVSRGRRH